MDTPSLTTDSNGRERSPSEGRIVTAAGTEVAYSVHGPGGDDPELSAAAPLVLTNGLTSDTAFWRYLLPRWSRSRRVLTWDLPGHGRSGPARAHADATIAGQPTIIAQLLDAVGMDSAIQIGWSTGCQVVLELYRHAPARCTALVLLLGGPGRVLDTAELPLPGAAIDWIMQKAPRPIFDGAAFLLTRGANNRLGHALGRTLGLLGADARAEDLAHITEHLCTLDTATVQAMVHSAQVHSAHDLLPTIDVPVLVVAGDRDPFAPAVQVGLPMHASTPGSELLRLPEGTHTALLDHADPIGDAVEDFMARRAPM